MCITVLYFDLSCCVHGLVFFVSPGSCSIITAGWLFASHVSTCVLFCGFSQPPCRLCDVMIISLTLGGIFVFDSIQCLPCLHLALAVLSRDVPYVILLACSAFLCLVPGLGPCCFCCVYGVLGDCLLICVGWGGFGWPCGSMGILFWLIPSLFASSCINVSSGSVGCVVGSFGSFFCMNPMKVSSISGSSVLVVVAANGGLVACVLFLLLVFWVQCVFVWWVALLV